MTICPICNGDGWHLAWCAAGPGPAPEGEDGDGYGRAPYVMGALPELPFQSPPGRPVGEQRPDGTSGSSIAVEPAPDLELLLYDACCEIERLRRSYVHGYDPPARNHRGET